MFELRTLYTVWRYQNNRLFQDPQAIRRKLVQFYFTFYVSMFVSLFYVLKFYFDKMWIFAAISVTWLPQIIKNVTSNNRLSMPLINIILFSVNRLVIPVMKIFNISYISEDVQRTSCICLMTTNLYGPACSRCYFR
jgi:hypothetical protein